MKIFGELELSKSLILADEPLAGFLEEMFEPDCQCGSWSLIKNGSEMDLEKFKGLYLYGHPIVDGALMDCLPNLKIVSNFGVGIDFKFAQNKPCVVILNIEKLDYFSYV